LSDGLCCIQTKEREAAGGASDAGVLRGDDEELDLLRNKIGERVREACQFEAKRIEVRGGARAHRRWRILPGMLTDVRTSDERLHRFGGVSCRRRKGRWRRVVRASYRRGSGRKRPGIYSN
jgi:hypothetical protein